MSKRSPKLLRIPFYGLDHEKVCEKMEGELTFLNEFCILDSYYPAAVYRNDNPNREKNHKDYMYIINSPDPLGSTRMVVGGLDKAEMEEFRYQGALWCQHCNTVVYSVYRHNMQECRCSAKKRQCAIDGGKDYGKISYGKEAHYLHVTLDLLTNTIKVPEVDEIITTIPFTPRKYKK